MTKIDELGGSLRTNISIQVRFILNFDFVLISQFHFSDPSKVEQQLRGAEGAGLLPGNERPRARHRPGGEPGRQPEHSREMQIWSHFQAIEGVVSSVKDLLNTEMCDHKEEDKDAVQRTIPIPLARVADIGLSKSPRGCKRRR